jgi:hypothetical protein
MTGAHGITSTEKRAVGKFYCPFLHNETNMNEPFYNVDQSVLLPLLSNESIPMGDRIMAWAVMTLRRPGIDLQPIPSELLATRFLTCAELLDMAIKDVEKDKKQ